MSHFFKKFKSLFIFVIVIFLFETSKTNSQTLSTQDLFSKGLILYRNNELEQAKIAFLALAARKDENPLITSAIYMLARTYYRLDNMDSALNYCETLVEQFPGSKYIADAYYLQGSIFYQREDWMKALTSFLFAVEFSQNDDLLRLSESTCMKIFNLGTSHKNIEQLYSFYNWKKAKSFVTLLLATSNYQNGNINEANILLDELSASHPEERYVLAIDKIKSLQFENSVPAIRIGIIQPVTGLFSDEAKDFLKGIAFALKKRKQHIPKIELVINDSKSTMVEAINAAFNCLDNDVDLIIGELEGNKSAAIAGVLKQSDTPLIVPLSTDNGLANIGDYIFQANNDLETRGRVLAEHAIHELQMKTFATLAPADEYGHALTDVFTKTVDLLGGTIVSQQWYYPGTQDFARQFESIREAGFRKAFRDSIESWGYAINSARIDSLYHIYNRQSRIDSDDNEPLAKFTDIPVLSIDGIFLPIYEEEIPFVASQLALYNIRARPLGGDYWNNAQILRQNQRYVNNILFTAGTFLPEIDIDFIEFTRDFRIATSSSPDIFAIYGYNVMNLLLEAINSGNISSRDISYYLSNVDNFNGLGCSISFKDNKRVNGSVNILQFLDGNIHKVNEK